MESPPDEGASVLPHTGDSAHSSNPFWCFEGKQAHEVFTTPDEYSTLCLHLHNENPANHFTIGWIPKGASKAKFAKNKRHTIEGAIASTLKCITGDTSAPFAVVFLKNEKDDASTAIFLDFDFHGPTRPSESEKLREFRVFIREASKRAQDGIYYLAESSGRGWHFWLIADRLIGADQWRDVVNGIAKGASFGNPAYKLHPFGDKGGRSKSQGLGMRAPGSANPNTWDPDARTFKFSLIHAHNLPPTFTKEKISSKRFLFSESAPSVSRTPSEDGRKGGASAIFEKFLAECRIVAPRTRHNRLLSLMGICIYQFGFKKCKEAAESLHRRAARAPMTPLEEHMREFEEEIYPYVLENNVEANLSAREREHYDRLRGIEKEAFCIIWNFQKRLPNDGPRSFPISGPDLAFRLSTSCPTIYGIRNSFIASRIIVLESSEWKPHVRACTYHWNVYA